jgi:hypothetical protein
MRLFNVGKIKIVNDKAMAILRAIERPIAVVIGVGTARIGDSSIFDMDRMM